MRGLRGASERRYLRGYVDNILSAMAAAAARGDDGMAGRLRDKDYCHRLQAIAYNVLAVAIYWYLLMSNLSC
jgi:hypothetical protein